MYNIAIKLKINKLIIIISLLLLFIIVLSIVLLVNPHHTKARYRLAESLDGQGKIAEAFSEVASLRRIYPEVNGFVADTGYDRPF